MKKKGKLLDYSVFWGYLHWGSILTWGLMGNEGNII